MIIVLHGSDHSCKSVQLITIHSVLFVCDRSRMNTIPLKFPRNVQLHLFEGLYFPNCSAPTHPIGSILIYFVVMNPFLAHKPIIRLTLKKQSR